MKIRINPVPGRPQPWKSFSTGFLIIMMIFSPIIITISFYAHNWFEFVLWILTFIIATFGNYQNYKNGIITISKD